MSIEIKEFGKDKDGNIINIYTIKNKNGLSASFIDLGAVWVDMWVPDKDGHLIDVVLGYDTVEKYEANPPHLGAPIGRYANRIAFGKFNINGIAYSLEMNSGKNSLHSGPDLWHKRIYAVDAYSDNSVSFSLHSKDMDQGFPGNCLFKIVYTLTDDNALKIDYSLLADKDTPCNITNHAYFNLAGHDNVNILEQEVCISADTFLPANENSIPTGEIKSVKDTAMDFREFKRIGKEIDSEDEAVIQGFGYDHNWIVEGHDKSQPIAMARDRSSGILMQVYTDLPGVQFYTGNFLNAAIEGKNGARYDKRSGYCFETQFYPNAINMENVPMPIARKDEEFKSFTIYKFLLDKKEV